MYESAVTTYTISGATGEIFIMLLVAFVLGALLGRAAAAPKPTHCFQGSVPTALPALRHDSLTLIEGLYPNAEEHLNTHGIFTWKMLSQTPVERLDRIFSEYTREPVRYIETWPTQAALASRNEWARLKELQDSLT